MDDFQPNYKESTIKYSLFALDLSNLLMDESKRIMISMITNILPHNLGELFDALCMMINDPCKRLMIYANDEETEFSNMRITQWYRKYEKFLQRDLRYYSQSQCYQYWNLGKWPQTKGNNDSSLKHKSPGYNNKNCGIDKWKNYQLIQWLRDESTENMSIVIEPKNN
jgi:hypothetical protein